MAETAGDGRTRALLVGAETALSVIGACMVFVFPVYAWSAYFCIGTCPGPDPEAIGFYRVLVGLLGMVVVATMTVAWRRGARVAYAWHVFVALAGVASAIVFQVPAVDWADHFREDPPTPDPSYVPCYSGSGECPGG